ncbi:hypothetical protein BU26DRAFT_500903 [Trematosphaeria pertusa]|uniref:Uncharacterized protein n=1 Tax=Trematosphaeria pertusa TaxID=390896 RepID=A0A6A6IXV0_9PLEO|nr:uncharacterized protein BU26DRAFT_500903 [Trematosphaeria pertusa]KAF2255319.1 hypothetical protein BU26DRAFT_500903 [Trematosphaeria pertusa]
MPPKGLYSIPRHHLYGGQMARRTTFNSKDFEDAAPAQLDGAAERQRKDEKKPRKKEKDSLGEKKKKDGAQVEPTSGGPVQPGGAVKPHQEGEKKSRKKNRDSLGDKKNEDGAKVIGVTPEVKDSKIKRKRDKKKGEEIQEHHSSKKKRKRESEVSVDTPTAKDTANGRFVIGENLVKDVEASLNGHTSRVVGTEAPQVEQPSKKKKASKKSKDVERQEQLEVSGAVQNGPTKTPEKLKSKKHKGKSDGGVGQKNGETTPNAPAPAAQSTPKKTPVPLPQVSRVPVSSATHHLQQPPSEIRDREPNVLVPETPPSRSIKKAHADRMTPIPFPLSHPTGNQTAGRKPPKKERLTALFSTPTSTGSAPAPLAKPKQSVPTPSIPNALTDANLEQFTQPLNDAPKPRPRAKGGSSAGTSLPDSTTSSMSIDEMFARVPKPYVRSGAEVYPFIATKAKKKTRETHEEAPVNVFNGIFHDLQKAVNFTEERGYLEEYLVWANDHEAVRLPCLGSVTGCNLKKEEILRLGKEENMSMSILGHLDYGGGDSNALMEADLHAQNAENFLMMAVHARVPVPIGRLEGLWTLYCPKYSETHFDKYGFGQRTLIISSIAGFKDTNTYTARLHIPPRSMPISIRAFTSPPHASFRSTTIETVAEGYKMDVVFLGNGYLQMRADLNLLLRGKATEEVEGKKADMEFIGVHEKATPWVEQKDELEEEGKRLFAKYDGGGRE